MGARCRTALERALSTLCRLRRVRTVCAGRTDAGVHALNQVVHFDAPVEREAFSWVRGTNRYLPRDIAVQWSAAGAGRLPRPLRGARAALPLSCCCDSPVRPSLEAGLVRLGVRPLDARRRCATRRGA